MSLILGEIDAARSHLQGMLLVFEQLHGVAPQGIYVPSPVIMTPLTTLIWRMAIRVDFICSIACGKPPMLPRCRSLRVSKLILLVSLTERMMSY